MFSQDLSTEFHAIRVGVVQGEDLGEGNVFEGWNAFVSDGSIGEAKRGARYTHRQMILLLQVDDP